MGFLVQKMGVKINLRIITKNHEADLEIGALEKSIAKLFGRETAMPTAWEFKHFFFSRLWLSITLDTKNYTAYPNKKPPKKNLRVV